MPKFSRASTRGRVPTSLPSLLATTSVAALLLGAAAASPARAQTPVVVTNPTPVNGTFTIGPDATALVIDQQSFMGDIVNPNFLPLNSAAQLSGTNTGIAIRSRSFNGSVTNAGTINVSIFNGFVTTSCPSPHAGGRRAAKCDRHRHRAEPEWRLGRHLRWGASSTPARSSRLAYR